MSLPFSFFLSVIFLFGWSFLGYRAFRDIELRAVRVTIPFLAAPLLYDWLRYLSAVPFGVGWVSSLGIVAFGLAATACLKNNEDSRRPAGGWTWVLLFFVANAILRTWLASGSVPNPADDIFSGYKANSVYHALGMFLPHPEAPELAMNYYYYIYAWPAWFGWAFKLPLLYGWWLTAVFFCSLGAWMVFEVFSSLMELRRLRDRWALWLLLVCGSSLSLLAALPLRLSPRFWGSELKHLLPEDLYVRIPQLVAFYWAPFVPLCMGLLAVCCLWFPDVLAGNRPFAKAGFLALAVASLAGYCTFFLMGFVLVVAPAVFVSCAVWKGWRAIPGMMLRMVAVGGAAILACLPILLEFFGREPGVRNPRFRPLLSWLSGLPRGEWLPAVSWVLFCVVLIWIIANPLGIAGAFSRGVKKEGPHRLMFVVMFLWGTVVCVLGVVDDFVPKFGLWVALAGAGVFLLAGKHLTRWGFALWAATLIMPGLLVLNTVRANLAKGRLDPVWKVLDAEGAEKNRPVLYRLGTDEQEKRTPWEDIVPYYSRAQFYAAVEEIDETGRNFLKNPSGLEGLRRLSLEDRLKGPGEYLYLTSADGQGPGELIYSSTLFHLYLCKKP